MKNINYNRIVASEIRALKKDSNYIRTLEFTQHGNTTVYAHSVKVAVISCYIARKFKIDVDYSSLIRGALLHDYFLYDWHDKTAHEGWHGFRHPRKAWKNAKKEYKLNKIEEDIILKHMFPIVPFIPRYKESWIVSTADKISAVFEMINQIKLVDKFKSFIYSIRKAEVFI